MISAVQTASAGLAQAANRFDKAAGDVILTGSGDSANPGSATQIDLSTSAIELMKAQTEVRANAAVLKSADALQKRLLDIVA